jgi:hypothetical protein
MSTHPPRVFVVNLPITKDGSPAVNVSGAAAFGAMVHVFPPGRRPLDPAALRDAATKSLEAFTESDWLLPVGHPVLIAIAAAVAAERTGGTLPLLVWDNQSFVYERLVVELAHCTACGGGGWVEVHSENPPAFDECGVCFNPLNLPSP